MCGVMSVKKKTEEVYDSHHDDNEKEKRDGDEGINYWHDDDPDHSDHLDAHHDNEELFLWMRRYCNTRQDLLM